MVRAVLYFNSDGIYDDRILNIVRQETALDACLSPRQDFITAAHRVASQAVWQVRSTTFQTAYRTLQLLSIFKLPNLSNWTTRMS